jgi:hypothetical protein
MTRPRGALLAPAALGALLLLVGCSSAANDHSGASRSSAAGPAATGPAAAGLGPGLATSESGYTLSPVAAPAAAGQPGTLAFHLTGPDGSVLTHFDLAHDKDLHLVVVRADTAQYRHVHPTMAADGTWSIPWTWQAGGTYRVFTDIVPTGGPGDLVLSRTVQVAGDEAAVPVPAPAPVTEVDGYQVRLTGALNTGGSMVSFDISEDGRPVTDLDQYLGAYGHLVALRTGDLAYLHVHPVDGPPGPTVTFHAEPPTAGRYRLFLDFAHGGRVHTAVFTADATAAPPSPASSMPPMPGMSTTGMNMPGMR